MSKKNANNGRDTMSKNNKAFDKEFERYSNPLKKLCLLKYVVSEVYLWTRMLNRNMLEEYRTPALDTLNLEITDELQMSYRYAVTS